MKRLLVFLAAVLGVVACAQDGNTTLLLHCNGTMNGAQGEVPMLSNGVTYEAGILANGAYLTNSNQVYYPRASNFDPREGTLQFWVKPKWAGNDNQGHVFLRHGGAGGVLLAKDGGNYLRSIFNRYGVNGLPEAGVGINIDSWSANSWHNVAYTWSKTGKFLKLYVDGQLAASTTLTFNLPDVASTTFQIGADSTGDYANAVIDELEISNIARSDAYIASMYLYSLTVNSLSITPDSAEIYKSWKKRFDVTAETNIGTVSVPAVALTWTSNHPDVAAVQEDGRAVGLAAGIATLTGTLNGASDTVQITVKAPVLEPDEEQIEPYLSDLPPLFKYEMPVVAIRYIPTNDGITVDSTVSDFYGSIADLKKNIGRFERESKFMLQEGSRYHGYKNPNAQPSLGYRVVKIINVYEPLPPDELHPLGGGVFFPDYNQILSRINMMQLVNSQRVKEVWLWGYHHGNIAPVESNMSSPLSGDISNSYRWNDDLPIYDRTYTLYNYNYTRSSNEAVHDHGHQLEAILSYVAWRQDGNDDLFWKKFVGINDSGQFAPGRCGDTHFPPNGESDYDYWNMNYVWSDVEDWNPLGTGAQKQVNANTWGDLGYSWPGGQVPEDVIQHQFYIYWMQAMPGAYQQIPWNGGWLTDWWALTGDWDATVRKLGASYGLYTTAPAISGNVVLADWYGLADGLDVVVQVEKPDGTPVASLSGVVDASGDFTFALPAAVLPGEYDVYVKVGHWLQRKHALVPISKHGVFALTFDLQNGDSDGNNYVGTDDYLILNSAFDASVGDANYDARADLNGDGYVGTDDYLILNGAFDTYGD